MVDAPAVVARDVVGMVGASDDGYAAGGGVVVQIHGIRKRHDVELTRHVVGGRGDAREVIGREVGQLEHQVVQLVRAEEVVDFDAEGEVPLELVGARIGPAGHHCRHAVGVERGQRQSHDGAVAMAQHEGFDREHGVDKLVDVPRHQIVGNDARVRTLALATAVYTVDRVIGGEILRQRFKGVRIAPVAVDEHHGLRARAVAHIVHAHVG